MTTVARVTSSDLDRLEFEALHSDDHTHTARELLRLADEIDPTSEVTRAELLVRAGEQWEMAQEFQCALAAYRRAVDDGGATVIDARALCVGALLELDRVEEAYTQLARISAEGHSDLPTHVALVEILSAHGDLRAAHEWATLGVARFQGKESTRQWELYTELLRLRYRIRVDIGVAEDEFDRLLDS